MPAGTHEILASVGGKPKRVKVICQPDDAIRLDAQLQQQLHRAERGEQSRPFIDFDHAGAEAAALPTRFFWQDGIRLAVQWTKAGEDAIRGRVYSYFSPEFLLAEDGRPAALPDIGAIGSLVNTPAFQDIEKLSAAIADVLDNQGDTKNTKNNINTNNPPKESQMKKLLDALMEAKLIITADNVTEDQVTAQFAAAWVSIQSSIAKLTAERDTAIAAAAAAAKARAEAVVQAAVESRRIKPEHKERWVLALSADERAADLLQGIEPAATPGHAGSRLPSATGSDMSPAGRLQAYRVMPEGKEKSEFLRLNAKTLLAAERAART
jgi:phage I-like protein